jgi:hypothetical protein
MNKVVPAAMLYAKSHDPNATYRGTLCQIEAPIARARAGDVSILSDGSRVTFLVTSVCLTFLLPRRNHLVIAIWSCFRIENGKQTLTNSICFNEI